mmetsp:Transcript_29510/g.42212  ORF Transcript_29510/g.42212 Transcript_29510/m.42212 type:complete len:375 (+) Transcript_29510:139-1263(+)|eukprot:CAMPEP_0172427578 /NCGR_PEP_ID=MMETSP1064-20121228/42600_1 /TAXON_ID=202472 /ORGANISM="Aulacoseira subarctica , Strain CCAP 1002/5" /LENGTH=374 /DNA_ID=CAMNT_0013171847 /DNA_START=70 /DNA_END=1194 /DNA_ORIENTATION=+
MSTSGVAIRILPEGTSAQLTKAEWTSEETRMNELRPSPTQPTTSITKRVDDEVEVRKQPKRKIRRSSRRSQAFGTVGQANGDVFGDDAEKSTSGLDLIDDGPEQVCVLDKKARPLTIPRRQRGVRSIDANLASSSAGVKIPEKISSQVEMGVEEPVVTPPISSGLEPSLMSKTSDSKTKGNANIDASFDFFTGDATLSSLKFNKEIVQNVEESATKSKNDAELISVNEKQVLDTVRGPKEKKVSISPSAFDLKQIERARNRKCLKTLDEDTSYASTSESSYTDASLALIPKSNHAHNCMAWSAYRSCGDFDENASHGTSGTGYTDSSLDITIGDLQNEVELMCSYDSWLALQKMITDFIDRFIEEEDIEVVKTK